jgi:ubiquinone biosynthesis protein Coq4
MKSDISIDERPRSQPVQLPDFSELPKNTFWKMDLVEIGRFFFYR